MSAALAISLPPRAHASAANDNTPLRPARTKVNLRLAAQRRFDSQDQIPRRVYDHMGKLAYSHKHTDGEGVTPIRLQSGPMRRVSRALARRRGYGVRCAKDKSFSSRRRLELIHRINSETAGLNPTSGWHDNATSGFVPPFGPGSNAGVTGFTDHVKDVETGLTYMQARQKSLVPR